MKQIIIIFFLLISPLTYCKINNIDSDESLSKTKISKLLDKTKVIKTNSPDIYNGQLDSLQQSQINIYLEKIIGSEYDKSKKTMIHLYKEQGGNLKKDVKNKKYWSWINTNSKKYQAFLIGTKNSKIQEEKKNHIYEDSYNLFENLFFKESNFKINHILIKPTGEFSIIYGHDDILYVLDWLI